MAEFEYTARKRSGESVSGSITATRKTDLRRKLTEKRLSAVHVSRSDSRPAESISFFARLRRISHKDVALFAWQLYTMTDAGIPLIRSLNSIIRQTKNERLKNIIRGVVGDINKGMSLSEAMKKYPKAFSPFFVSMIEVGEIGGKLDRVLEDVAKYYETMVERRSKIISALSYPTLLLVGCFGVVAFLIFFLVPRLFVMFEDVGADIPATTSVLIGLGGFLQNNLLYVLGVLVASVIGIRLYIKTESGRHAVDTLVLRIPIVGNIVKKIILSRFAHSLSIMINGGVPLMSSLRITREIVRNSAIRRIVDDLISCVSEGDPINEVLSRHRLIPDMVVNMVAVGEETGKLGEMLKKVSSYYDREVNSSINNLTKIAEPVLLVGMAAVVGFIAISILDPITDLIVNINR